MKIGYFADGPWSHFALELMLKDDTLKIEFIVNSIVFSELYTGM